MILLNLFKLCNIALLLTRRNIYCFLSQTYFNFELNKLTSNPFLILASNKPSSSKFHQEERKKLEEDFKRILETAKSLNLSEKELNEYALKHLPEERLRKRFLYLINPKKVEKVLPKRLKKHLAILPKKNIQYSIDEAISRTKIISGTKFKEGIDVAIRIPVTTKKAKSTAGQYAKLITIPYKSLKSKRTRLGIFALKDTVEEIKTKVFIGGEELVKQFKEKEEVPEVDLVLCDVETYPKLSLLGRLLSKKGLMPNLAVGTCIESKTEFLEIIEDFIDKNLLVIKSDKAGDIKCNFADVTMPLDEIRSNLLEIYR